MRVAISILDRGRRTARPVLRAKAGFTLVEMLVVLAIIGLLVGLIAPRVFNQLANAKVRTAHVQIESFKNALDLFFFDTGRYPTTNEGLTALAARPAGVATWNGPYLKSENIPRDPWNNPYVYHAPGHANHPYDIASYGAHGQEGGTPDITAW